MISDPIASSLVAVLDASDELFAHNEGEPRQGSRARLEVDQYDEVLAEATGTVRPVFGAYADAEAKLRCLIDLTRSFACLIGCPGTIVGQSVVARTVIETGSRLYWALAVDHDHRERAARWLRERLRSIQEVSRFGPDARQQMEQHKYAETIRDGAAKAGLDVPGQPPAAVDLIWPTMTMVGSPMQFDGIDRTEAMALFYRSPSASIHATAHGAAMHFADPEEHLLRRATCPLSPDETLILTAGVLNAFANPHQALADLYGWDATSVAEAQLVVAGQLTSELDAVRDPAYDAGLPG